MVASLLAAGAALEAESKRGWRALHFAAAHGHASTVEALLAAGAALEAETRLEGWRALHLAAWTGYPPNPSLLSEWKAYTSAARDHGLVLAKLIAAGADLTIFWAQRAAACGLRWPQIGVGGDFGGNQTVPSQSLVGLAVGPWCRQMR